MTDPPSPTPRAQNKKEKLWQRAGSGGADSIMPKRIQRKRSKGWRMPEGAVYVGRPTKKWGNPFIVSSHGAMDAYRDYTKNHDLWTEWPCVDAATAVRAFREMKAPTYDVADMSELRGKDLACWCPLDQPCHADVLLELANADQCSSAPSVGNTTPDQEKD